MITKKVKLEIIDRAIVTVKMNGKMGCGNPKTPLPKRGCGNYSREYANGWNDAIKITLYNLKIERQLIYHDVSSVYELAVKTGKKRLYRFI